ncbi:3-deoxy-manno-octulosonate cytidylyltransferase [Halocynthiibacter namhaensis]|uniref:3-deoxy-manno-octulosonate cytidylyltransferase n=1 Tax=Halocynthiibacter namhaensis TaxID=1290553 RepID=UPI0005791BC9|nr:manno-octulosonate cytidylyltransferase [Halocynthiibacter namhaensis]
MTEKAVIIIPARYGSTRFEGKPLAPLVGATGVSKSLIQRSWDTAMEVDGVDGVYVATDDERIADAARAFGADVLMTATDCANGTERVADALRSLPSQPDIVVNLQGDAPLTPPWFITDLIAEMRRDKSVRMATPVLRCDGLTLKNFREDRRNGRVGGTTAVFNTARDALYFSKEVLPYTDDTYTPGAETPVFHHVGAYAYRPATLTQYVNWGECVLEQLEGLEQLRFLANGVPVRCVEVEGRGRVFWELNNPVDVARIETVLREKGWE